MAIKRAFRKHPVVSTVATAGSVNVLLGVLEGQALLAFLGVLVVSGTLSLWGWQRYRRLPEYSDHSPIRYLPEQTAQIPMSVLGRSPQRDR